MKRILGLSIFMFAGWTVSAQQQYQFSQYQTNPYLFNPAASGIYDYIDITAGFRQQWAGFTNAPRTFYLGGHTALGGQKKPLYNPSLRIGRKGPVKTPEIKTGKMKHVIGGLFFGDEYGAFKQYTANVTYALHLPVAKGYNLAAGIGVGYSQYMFDQNKVDLLNDVDPNYNAFLSGGPNSGYLDATAGLWFYSNNLFVGYSSGELLRSLVKFGSVPVDFDLRMHHYITAGYKIDVSQELSITPSALVKFMSPAPVSIDGTVLVTYEEFIWGGISYRHGDAIIGLFGLNLSELFKLGYSYDFTLSKLNAYNNGGHEITLGVTLGR